MAHPQTFAALPTVTEHMNIGGELIEITPVRIGELPALAKVIRPIAARLTTEPDWLALLSEEGELVLTLLAIVARRSRQWIDQLALDEAIQLTQALFEANADFFVHKVVPELTRLASHLNRHLPGPISSSASSSTATVTTTS